MLGYGERYKQLIDLQIVPHLGDNPLQKLRPTQIKAWHTHLLTEGRKDGGSLAPRTVQHAHRVLRKALVDAVRLGPLARNVVATLPPPKVNERELEILAEADVAQLMTALRDQPLHPVVALALATGMRRGELLALRWADVDIDGAKLRVERALEETTAGGVRVKGPKTSKGRRTITLPASTVEMLSKHRAQQLRERMRHGMGTLPKDALEFPCPVTDGPVSPNKITREWRRLVSELGLAPISFHALRHTHASALIAAGVDVVTVSRRLGHSSASVKLDVYAHLFTPQDQAAAAIEEALGHLGSTFRYQFGTNWA